MSLSVEWVEREPPLEVAAVVAIGESARRLAHRCLDRAAPSGAGWSACVGSHSLLVIGSGDDLPWVDGAVYLGWDGGILLPTALAPAIPVDLLALAARRRVGAVVDDVVACWGSVVVVSPRPSGDLDVARLAGMVAEAG